MNNYTDELFLKKAKKIVEKYDGEIVYYNILTRQFWVDCPEGVEETISLEIESLLTEFKSNYPDFEKEKETTIDGWPKNIGDTIR